MAPLFENIAIPVEFAAFKKYSIPLMEDKFEESRKCQGP